MSLFRTSVLSAFSTVTRLLCGLIINKVVAVIGGPVGFAVVSQLQNAFALASTLSSGAMGNGVTILTARHENDPIEQKKFFNTAIYTILACSLPFTLIGIYFSHHISLLLLYDADYYYVVIAAALTIPLFAFGSMLTAIATGKQDIVSVVGISIVSSVFTLILSVLLAWFYGLPGALVATATYQAGLLLIALCWLWRQPWLRSASLFAGAARPYFKDIFRFLLMAGISGICINLAKFLVRNQIISYSGLESAGIWDTVNRISILNWTLVSAFLSVYLIPKLSSLREDKLIKIEIKKSINFIMPLFVFICVVISLFSDNIFEILFTKEFSEADRLLPIQLAGDIARVFSWFYAYVLIIQQRILHYALIEICSNAAFVFFTVMGFGLWGDLSPVVAHACTFGVLAMYCGVRIWAMAREK